MIISLHIIIRTLRNIFTWHSYTSYAIPHSKGVDEPPLIKPLYIYIYIITRIIIMKEKRKPSLKKDRGSHHDPTYHDHKRLTQVTFPLWLPHQGNGLWHLGSKDKMSHHNPASSLCYDLVSAIVVISLPNQDSGLFGKILFKLLIEDTGSSMG